MASATSDSDYRCSLCPESIAKAKKELGETPESRKVEVKELRKRVEKIPGVDFLCHYCLNFYTVRLGFTLNAIRFITFFPRDYHCGTIRARVGLRRNTVAKLQVKTAKVGHIVPQIGGVM